MTIRLGTGAARPLCFEDLPETLIREEPGIKKLEWSVG